MRGFHLVVVAAALCLSACVSSGVKVDTNKVAAFEKGKTTYGDVVANLGQPTSFFNLPDGTHSISYTYMQVRSRPESFVPLVGAFIGGADSQIQMVTLTFDSNNVLKEVSSMGTNVGSGMGAASTTRPSDRTSQPIRQ